MILTDDDSDRNIVDLGVVQACGVEVFHRLVFSKTEGSLLVDLAIPATDKVNTVMPQQETAIRMK